MSLSNFATFAFDKSTSNLRFTAPKHSFSHLTTQGTYQDALTISRQNIGIGTSTPNYKLDVYGQANISSNLYVSGTLFAPSVSGISYLGGTLARTTEIVSSPSKSIFTVNVSGVHEFTEDDVHIFVNGLKLGHISENSTDYSVSYVQEALSTSVTISLVEPTVEGDVVEISLSQPFVVNTSNTSNEVVKKQPLLQTITPQKISYETYYKTFSWIYQGSGDNFDLSTLYIQSYLSTGCNVSSYKESPQFGYDLKIVNIGNNTTVIQQGLSNDVPMVHSLLLSNLSQSNTTLELHVRKKNYGDFVYIDGISFAFQ